MVMRTQISAPHAGRCTKPCMSAVRCMYAGFIAYIEPWASFPQQSSTLSVPYLPLFFAVVAFVKRGAALQFRSQSFVAPTSSGSHCRPASQAALDPAGRRCHRSVKVRLRLQLLESSTS
jgi:hypothetical protein